MPKKSKNSEPDEAAMVRMAMAQERKNLKLLAEVRAIRNVLVNEWAKGQMRQEISKNPKLTEDEVEKMQGEFYEKCEARINADMKVILQQFYEIIEDGNAEIAALIDNRKTEDI